MDIILKWDHVDISPFTVLVQVHLQYLEAGADVIISSSYQVSSGFHLQNYRRHDRPNSELEKKVCFMFQFNRP